MIVPSASMDIKSGGGKPDHRTIEGEVGLLLGDLFGLLDHVFDVSDHPLEFLFRFDRLENGLVAALLQAHDDDRALLVVLAALRYLAEVQEQSVLLLLELENIKDLARIGVPVVAFQGNYGGLLVVLRLRAHSIVPQLGRAPARSASFLNCSSVPSAISTSPSWKTISVDGFVISLPSWVRARTIAPDNFLIAASPRLLPASAEPPAMPIWSMRRSEPGVCMATSRNSVTSGWVTAVAILRPQMTNGEITMCAPARRILASAPGLAERQTMVIFSFMALADKAMKVLAVSSGRAQMIPDAFSMPAALSSSSAEASPSRTRKPACSAFFTCAGSSSITTKETWVEWKCLQTSAPVRPKPQTI